MILRLFWGLAPAVGAGVGRGWLWGRWVASGRAARVVAHFSRLFLTSFARRALMPFQDDNRPSFSHMALVVVGCRGVGRGWGGGAFGGFVRLCDWRWRSFRFFPPSFLHLVLPSGGPESHQVLSARPCCQVFWRPSCLGRLMRSLASSSLRGSSLSPHQHSLGTLAS